MVWICSVISICTFSNNLVVFKLAVLAVGYCCVAFLVERFEIFFGCSTELCGMLIICLFCLESTRCDLFAGSKGCACVVYTF